MLSRLRTVALLFLVGFAGFCRPSAATAQTGAAPDPEAALARKREEIRDTQVLYGYIGGSAVGVAVLIIFFLNSANKREKKLAERYKRKRPLDPDAPLGDEPPAAGQPSVE